MLTSLNTFNIYITTKVRAMNIKYIHHELETLLMQKLKQNSKFIPGLKFYIYVTVHNYLKCYIFVVTTSLDLDDYILLIKSANVYHRLA
jgi:hypothetical protein